MKRLPQQSPTTETPTLDAAAVARIKVWLIGVSPMVWRRVLVSSSFTLRELHGVIQVAMGWEGVHLYEFSLRAARYGSSELSASSPDVTVAALRLRKGTRFRYEYDLNIPWQHEVRIEDWLTPGTGKTYPTCTDGDGACPPEDCGGPAAFMAHRDDILSLDGMEDLETMAEILGEVAQERRPELLEDKDTIWRLEQALERSRERKEAQGRTFERRTINARLNASEHRELMHQQW